jgi:myo-inositol-1(or 4)-monophosphatase
VAFNVARATSNAIYQVRDDADRMEIAADRVSSSVAHRDSPSDPHHAIVSAVTVDSDLNKIEAALDAASEALRPFVAGSVEASFERGDDPLTEADLAVDEAVKGVLSSPEDGWLSEETADSAARLGCRRTWVVDPLDGTREFVKGIPEWCVSVGLVEDGVPVAGGILAPAAGLRIVGAMDRGVTLNGVATGARKATSIQGALVLASRSEVKRGLWSPFFATDISIRSMGSVALKLALVAVGLADATWTLVPKNEWDVAAGAALVLASGGRVSLPDGTTRSFNSPDPLLPGFIATVHGLFEPIHDLVVHTIASQNDV